MLATPRVLVPLAQQQVAGARRPAYVGCTIVHGVRPPALKAQRGTVAHCKKPDDGDAHGVQEVVSKLVRRCSKTTQDVVQALSPKQAGDARDWGLVMFSTIVLMWLSAQLYRVYVFMDMMDKLGGPNWTE